MRNILTVLIVCSFCFIGCKTFHLEGGDYIPNEIILGGGDTKETVAKYLGFAAISPKENSKPLPPKNKASVKFQPGYFMLESNPGFMNKGDIIPVPITKKVEMLVGLQDSYEFDIGITTKNIEDKISSFNQQITALNGVSSEAATVAELTKKTKSLKYEIEIARFFSKGSNSISIKISDIHNYYQLDPEKYKISKEALNKICKDGKILKNEPNSYLSEIYEISGTLEFISSSTFSTGLKANFDNKVKELKKTTGFDGSLNLKYDSSVGNYHKFKITQAWMLINVRTISDNDCPKL